VHKESVVIGVGIFGGYDIAEAAVQGLVIPEFVARSHEPNEFQTFVLDDLRREIITSLKMLQVFICKEGHTVSIVGIAVFSPQSRLHAEHLFE